MSEQILRADVEAYTRQVNSSGKKWLYEMPIGIARRATHILAREADLPLEKTLVDQNILMPTPDSEQIKLRLFDTRESRTPGPVIVYFHGGGWILGDVDVYASPCAEIARQLDLPLLSVEYRRAPEYKTPVGQQDCEAAARWIASNPTELPVKATSLILMGDSCGGAFTISTAMALRDAPAAVPVLAHLAFYPSADLGTRYQSFKDYATGYLLDKHLMRWFAEQSAPDDTDYRTSPMAGDLHGLSPAMVVTTELDPLRDQGRAYAEALASAGVPVVAYEVKGMVHAFLSMRKVIPSGQAELEKCLSMFRELIERQANPIVS